ncbi:MAG: hypothetical protein IJX26_01460 [Clostridia bacterium]|nr:hypothetical protein [Clostridia bacterium]
MSYVDRNGVQRFTLKEKYQYYKALAEKGVNSKGEKVGFTSRVGLATRANAINRKQGKNKRRNSYYTGK